MLKPVKHMNLDNSLIRISAILIQFLKSLKIVKFNQLLERLVTKEGDEVKYMYVPALNFMYLLGLIEYHSKNDTIEFIFKGK